MKAQKGSTGIAVLFHKLAAKWGWVVSTTSQDFSIVVQKTDFKYYFSLIALFLNNGCVQD
jgi:hypothetical protein